MIVTIQLPFAELWMVTYYNKISGTISRVMSWVIIYLELLLPTVSSDPPESRSGKSMAFVLVLLRMGFTCAPSVTRRAVVSYSAFPPLPDCYKLHWLNYSMQFITVRRFISVALALESPPPDVIRHPALWSPDFPHLSYDSRDHLSHLSLNHNIIYIPKYLKAFFLFWQVKYFILFLHLKAASTYKFSYNGIHRQFFCSYS